MDSIKKSILILKYHVSLQWREKKGGLREKENHQKCSSCRL
jgi:hypothetical protein